MNRWKNKLRKIFLGLFLFFQKRKQYHLFRELRPDARKYMADFSGVDLAPYVIEQWRDNYERMEKIFRRKPPFAFLKDPTIKYTMCPGWSVWTDKELDYLRSEFPAELLEELAREDAVGGPELMDGRLMTSANSIHHLYHLARFRAETGVSWDDINTVVEWGGGYGNLIKILRRLKQGSGTYIMIDLPVFCVMQWLYLAVILGPDQIRLISGPDQVIETGKINILPVNFLKSYDLKSDLFISTWALSESSEFSQDLARDKGLLESRHLLIAYQPANSDFPTAGRIEGLVSGEKRIADVGLKNSKYLFR